VLSGVLAVLLVLSGETYSGLRRAQRRVARWVAARLIGAGLYLFGGPRLRRAMRGSR